MPRQLSQNSDVPRVDGQTRNAQAAVNDTTGGSRPERIAGRNSLRRRALRRPEQASATLLSWPPVADTPLACRYLRRLRQPITPTLAAGRARAGRHVPVVGREGTALWIRHLWERVWPPVSWVH